MESILTLLLLAATGAADEAMPAAAEADIAWVVDSGLCEPESVLALPDDTLLVSNVCGFRQTGNGYLTRLDGQGRVLAERAVDGLDAPLGMALSSGALLVIDGNRVRVLSWPQLEQQRLVALDTAVANDIAVSADGDWFVTDTARGQVLRVTPDGEQSLVAGEGRFPGANGVAVAGRHLYVGGERLWCLDLETGEIKTLGPAWLTDIDGIEIESDGTLQVTPVGGPLVRLSGNRVLGVWGGEGVSSANHGYAPRLGLVLIPTGFDNTVMALRTAGF